jgi:Ca2+-transporting ATPase
VTPTRTQTYNKNTDDVLTEHETSREGLKTDEAEKRLAEHGENDIVRGEGRSATRIFVAQFDSVLIWVLVAAALLSVWTGHAVDAALITVIVVANGVFGFVQDYRAERSLEELRELAAPTATVLRDGEPMDIESTGVVPGDIVVLEGGDVVPADGRLTEATDFETDEAALTGESMPVSKSVEAVDGDTPVAERSCMVYKGTSVTRGRAKAVVTSTGMETEVGGIAEELATTEETSTPLQNELDSLGTKLGLGVVALSAVVAPLLLLRSTEPVQAGLTAVSLAVAAVPEGLPAVVTLTLALGVRKMTDENALVRRLPSVESLGSVDVICTDKTGTLTKGEMTVSRLWVHDRVTEVGGEREDEYGDRADEEPEGLLLRAGALCNNSTADEGDPTEQAIVRSAEETGFDVEKLRDKNTRTDEMPFSSERKWMGTVHETDKGRVGYVKGAPEVVLGNSESILTEDGVVELTEDIRESVEGAVNSFADDALRVLGVAYVDEPDDADALKDGLFFLGLTGMIDPPRDEVADAISATRRAGIDVKMVTGDNVRTAAAIAEELSFDAEVLEGSEVEEMDEAELRERVESVNVFARASPEHKVRILKALQQRGHYVAMTGDGVNDAPALKNADVGVAMGIRGTDVARQASDMILLDDNYATIERAVERGRSIFDNVWKFVAYLLSANVAEVAIVFVASLYGYLILPAVQLLWINLLTDGLPALALGADPKSEDVMQRPPREPDRGIVGRPMLELIGGTGAVTTVVMLALMFFVLDGAPSVTPYAMTMVFTGFVVLEFAKLYVIRWLRETPTLTNAWLIAAVVASILLQMAVLYTPLREYFDTVPLGVSDWGLLAVAVAVCLPVYLGVAVLVRRHLKD